MVADVEVRQLVDRTVERIRCKARRELYRPIITPLNTATSSTRGGVAILINGADWMRYRYYSSCGSATAFAKTNSQEVSLIFRCGRTGATRELTSHHYDHYDPPS